MGSYESSGYALGNDGFVDPSDRGSKDIKQFMDHIYNAYYPHAGRLWAEGYIDKRFKVGDQSLYAQAFGNDNQSQNYQRFFLNLIRRHINMICGYQRKNRKSTVTLPVKENDDTLADDYNKVMRWSEDRDGFQEYLSQAFEGSCDTGETLLYLYPDYTLDPISGDLFTDQVSYNNYLIDPYYRKQDLTDCNAIWRRRWTTKEGAKQMLRGMAKEIDKMKSGGMKDGRFPLQAELQNVAIHNLFTYDEFHYRSTREATIVLDPHSGEAVEWEEDEEDEDDMMERTLAQQPWLVVKKTQVPTVKLCISLGGKVVYHGKNLLNIDSYPCVPSICYHEPDMRCYGWRKMGVIRNLRDPQFLYNMRKMIELNILQTQINSGWIYPVDAVVDTKCFRQKGEGFLVPLKTGHLPQEIQRIEAAAIPQSLLELSASLAEDITKISGVNEELLGSATDDKSGILSMLRQGAGLVTLQTIFDKLDYTQRLYGKIRLQAIRKNFSKGKIRNILGHDPDPRFFTSHSQKYSIAVEEGNYSATQRQTELQQVLNFKELGIPIANKTIVRLAIITDKKKVLEEMAEEAQQQQQVQQAEMQSKQQIDQAKVMSELSKSKLNMAKVQESLAKADELESERERKDTESDLNLVKLMVELEDMQFAQFQNAFAHAQEIKAVNRADKEEQQKMSLAAQGV